MNTKRETSAEPKGINAPEKPQANLPAIDWTACMALCQGDQSIVREMLSVLAQDLKNAQSVLDKAYASRNMRILRAKLHCLRGGVCYLKCPELECCLKAFHEAVNAHPQDNTQLESTYTALQRAMQTFCQTWETDSAVS